jgi:hypothetical protein
VGSIAARTVTDDRPLQLWNLVVLGAQIDGST